LRPRARCAAARGCTVQAAAARLLAHAGPCVERACLPVAAPLTHPSTRADRFQKDAKAGKF
jgi:hypothetical protein